MLASCAVPTARVRRPSHGSDPSIQLILKELLHRQPRPYGLPDGTTYNYLWAQHAMALLAAERCGYLPRDEALARLRGMLDTIEPLERHFGFSFDGYDVTTGRRTTDKIYFQGWWFYALAVLKNAYPELAPACERMLSEVDYEKSGLFRSDTRQLAADYFLDKKEVSFWIDLYWQPTGEFRTPYVAYTYLTGDISPWTRHATPRIVDIEGHPTLGVWHNFVFCSMLVHTEYLDVGYMERSWDELTRGLEKYRRRNGMTFYPTRAEPLEAWLEVETNSQPNLEHRISKPWLAWLIRDDLPVMERSFTPGHGMSLYYDNMNLYWSFGGDPEPLALTLGPGAYRFPFTAQLLPTNYAIAHPPRLTSIQFIASRHGIPDETTTPIEIKLNGTTIATVQPSELRDAPSRIRREFANVILTNRQNTFELCCEGSRSGHGYTLYAFATNLWNCTYVVTDQSGPHELGARAPYFEITVDGQHDGGENAYALLARCALVHDYYVWREMLNDPVFLERTVAWVGDYYDRARLAGVVHNVADQPVTVRYERPHEWRDAESIKVLDITDSRRTALTPSIRRREIQWLAEPRHTYRVRYEK